MIIIIQKSGIASLEIQLKAIQDQKTPKARQLIHTEKFYVNQKTESSKASLELQLKANLDLKSPFNQIFDNTSDSDESAARLESQLKANLNYEKFLESGEASFEFQLKANQVLRIPSKQITQNSEIQSLFKPSQRSRFLFKEA